ncbi:MAG: hypothetical protein LAO03_13975 [Acidobacteriia bacterium]|nr:hypothetical protein [Terriglobia bacterium]
MPSAQTKPSNPEPLKHWTMIVFESLSVGITAILVIVGVALLAVGVYVQVIWPLTEWDLTDLHLGAYRPTVHFFLLVIFMVGSLVGFWFISGAAWGSKPERSRSPQPRQPERKRLTSPPPSRVRPTRP